MAFFKGKKLQLVEKESTETIDWKHGSVLGVGGDKCQTYNVCHYETVDGKFPILVYVQANYVLPQTLDVNGALQYGMNKGIVFLVYHDKSQTPYQHRFIQNPTQRMLAWASKLQKMKTGYDFSWIDGDYLRNF